MTPRAARWLMFRSLLALLVRVLVFALLILLALGLVFPLGRGLMLILAVAVALTISVLWHAVRLYPIVRSEYLGGMRRANLCPVCGYDLRATPDRCPECGTPKPAGAMSEKAQ